MTRRIRRTVQVLFLAALACVSLGCRTLARGVLWGAWDSAYETQFDDGRGQGGVTPTERRARFEEAGIRFMLRDQAYSHEGRVPDIPR